MNSIRPQVIAMAGPTVCAVVAGSWLIASSATVDDDITKVIAEASLMISSNPSSGIGVAFGTEVMKAMGERALPTILKITSPTTRAFSLTGAAQGAAEISRRDWVDALAVEVKKCRVADPADDLMVQTEMAFAFAWEGRSQIVRAIAYLVLKNVSHIPKADRRVAVLAHAAPIFLLSDRFAEAQKTLELAGARTSISNFQGNTWRSQNVLTQFGTNKYSSSLTLVRMQDGEHSQCRAGLLPNDTQGEGLECQLAVWLPAKEGRYGDARRAVQQVCGPPEKYSAYLTILTEYNKKQTKVANSKN